MKRLLQTILVFAPLALCQSAAPAQRKCDEILTGETVLRVLKAEGQWEAELFPDRPASTRTLFIILQLLANGRVEKDDLDSRLEQITNRAPETNRRYITYLCTNGLVAKIRTSGMFYMELTPEGYQKIAEMLAFTRR